MSEELTAKMDQLFSQIPSGIRENIIKKMSLKYLDKPGIERLIKSLPHGSVESSRVVRLDEGLEHGTVARSEPCPTCGKPR